MELSSETAPRFTPAELLNSQETVLFDTRPHFLSVVGPLSIFWFCVLSVVVPVVVAGVAQGLGATPATSGWCALAAWVFLLFLPMLLRVIRWRHEFYSLSDQRIMHGHGVINRSFDTKQLARIGGMLDVSTYRITGVTFNQGLTGRLFKFGNLNFQTNHGSVFWPGIKDPYTVRRLIEEKIATFQELGANQATYNEAVIRKVAEIKTEESFGLIQPRHQAAIPGNAGGASLPPAASAVRYCPHCGGQQPAEAAYCSKCGNPLG